MFAVLSSKNLTFYETDKSDQVYLKDLALNDIQFLECDATQNTQAMFDIHSNHGLISVFSHCHVRCSLFTFHLKYLFQEKHLELLMLKD